MVRTTQEIQQDYLTNQPQACVITFGKPTHPTVDPGTTYSSADIVRYEISSDGKIVVAILVPGQLDVLDIMEFLLNFDRSTAVFQRDFTADQYAEVGVQV